MKTVATLVFAFLLLSSLTSTFASPLSETGENGAQADLLITAVYPDTATRGEQDEFVAVTNPRPLSVNIEGWSLTDNEGRVVFPAFQLAPGETIFVSRNGSAFVKQMSNATSRTLSPAFEYAQMQTQGRAFVLRNSGDEVILQDESGQVVDALVYGDSDYKAKEGGGWRGEPLRKPVEGMVFTRRGVQDHQDTNQHEDWVLLQLGASYHAPQKFTFSGFDGVTAFVSPDCSFSVLQREIENASSSLCLNLYQFENPFLTEAVLAALERGVSVSLLLEGSPAGGLKDEELCVAQWLKEAGGEVRFADEPFLNHAKYAVLDNETTVVMSENWKSTGVPCNNTFGNRGWGVVVKNEAVASYFKAVFSEDFYRAKSTASGQGVEGQGVEEVAEVAAVCEAMKTNKAVAEGSYSPVFEPLTLSQNSNTNFTVIPVLAPDTAVSVLRLINSAEERVLVEQFSTRRFWGKGKGEGESEENPFVTALLEAARRGCEVKVLLNSKYLEGTDNNDEVVSWLNEVGCGSALRVEARLADLDSLGLVKIHSKGVVVDGEKVLVSSLNWNANSIYNREAGVIIENEEVASFFEKVFFHDWNASVESREERGGREEGGGRVESREERGGKEEGTRRKIKIVWLAVTLVISFAIFWAVKWHKSSN